MCTRQLPIRPGRYRRLHARVPARSRASAARAERSPERGIRVPDGPAHTQGPRSAATGFLGAVVQ